MYLHTCLIFQDRAPIKLRAEAVKAQASDMEAVRAKVDLKDEEVKELKKLLKMKVCCACPYSELQMLLSQMF